MTICARGTCRQPIRPCPDLERLNFCLYLPKCLGWIHEDGHHSCADFEGDAHPAPEATHIQKEGNSQ